MAVSLGWHIVFSCLGVAFPAMVMLAEWRGCRTGDPTLHELAHTWAKAPGTAGTGTAAAPARRGGARAPSGPTRAPIGRSRDGMRSSAT